MKKTGKRMKERTEQKEKEKEKREGKKPIYILDFRSQLAPDSLEHLSKNE